MKRKNASEAVGHSFMDQPEGGWYVGRLNGKLAYSDGAATFVAKIVNEANEFRLNLRREELNSTEVVSHAFFDDKLCVVFAPDIYVAERHYNEATRRFPGVQFYLSKYQTVVCQVDDEIVGAILPIAQRKTENEKGEAMKKNLERVQRKMFDQMCSLWKERETDPFVPQAVIHEALWRGKKISGGKVERRLADGGTDIIIAAFSRSGPDYEVFVTVLDTGFEPAQYFRYEVTRSGVVGYVRREDLTEAEGYAISSELRRKGEDAETEAAALDRRNRKLAVVAR